MNADDAALRGRVERHGVGLPTVPGHCEQGYHMYYILLPSLVLGLGLVLGSQGLLLPLCQ